MKTFVLGVALFTAWLAFVAHSLYSAWGVIPACAIDANYAQTVCLWQAMPFVCGCIICAGWRRWRQQQEGK